MRITEYLVAIIGKFSNKKQLVLQVELSIDKLKQNVDNFMKKIESIAQSVWGISKSRASSETQDNNG